ncbi:AAA family ATPase [Terrabacter sp. 2YAF2]|uniref:AAA family ATPase n=1 Tax=Terrabacter sp. 2YAF2 TaxID=3233026 RepID=UPI003F943DEC
MTILRPLLLTGGPAVGKTTTARALAEATEPCAFIDVDDVRQMIKSGGVAPWKGVEGRAQHLLGIRNAAALAANFTDSGINVILSDVVTQDLLSIYRDLVPELVVIRLVCDPSTAKARAGTRPVYLTAAEFEMLHRQQTEPLETDSELDVSAMTLEVQVDAVRRQWRSRSEDL